jgi:hypothetical protein
MTERLEGRVASMLLQHGINDRAVVDYIVAIITMDEEDDADKSQMISDFLAEATTVGQALL